jgi:ribonuclease P protein component
VRRRLREAARQVIPGQARTDLDYVLVGRQGAIARDFAALRQELFEALKRLKALGPASPVPSPVATP